MNDKIRPKLVFSRCLGFEACRYNGQIISDAFVEKLKPFVDGVVLCPESDIGMGIPRDPVRIVIENDVPVLFQPASGKRWTEQMNEYCSKTLGELGWVDGFLLKSRSPSCGFKDTKIYRGFDSSSGHKKGPGFFGRAVCEKFPDHPVEDEGRLKNWSIRDQFLTGVYTRAKFRAVLESEEMGQLVDFHSRNKLLYMSINQNAMRKMGRIIANHEKVHFSEVTAKYGKELGELLKTPSSYTNIINTALHAFGGVTEELSSKERKYFLDLLEEYRDERIPVSAVYTVLKSWALRMDNDYLLNQTFLSPYPKELTEITDSGKGRNL